jgi:tetratricopeptide (TPR) repeat protein
MVVLGRKTDFGEKASRINACPGRESGCAREPLKRREVFDTAMASQLTNKVLEAGDPRSAAAVEPFPARRRRFTWIWLLGLILIALGLGFYWYARRPGVAADALWEQAERDLGAERLDRAAEAVKRLGQSRSPTPLDRFLRGQLAFARNNADPALAELALVPDDHYMSARARLLAGQIELRRDRVRRAEELFRAALRLDPGLVQAHRELIYILGMQLRRAELHAEFLALSKLTELKFENVFHWCLLRNNTWEPKEMIETLSQYLAADPSDRFSRLALAENLRRLNLFDEVENVLAVLPRDDSAAIAIRVQSARDRQDQDEAERLLAAGASDDPALARLRGRLALSRQDAKSALHSFRIAYAADPENRETVFGLLLALEMNGDRKVAAPIRTQARNLERLNTLVNRAAARDAREDSDLLRQLGAACAALHRDAEARAWYKLVIARNPLDAESQRALFRLRDDGHGSPQPLTAKP